MRTGLDCDIAIVGAGPAGLGTAVLFARRNLRVIVCEKKQLPIDKACGEGIMPWATPFLGSLGLGRFLAGGHTHPFSGIRIIAPNHTRLDAPFKTGVGVGVRRLALSEALLLLSRKCPSVELCEHTTALSCTSTPDGFILRTNRGDVSTRLLIGADGLHSRVRHWAGLARPMWGAQRYGTTQHFEVKPWSPYVEIHFQPNLEAYVTPCGPRLVGIAFLWDKARLSVKGTDDERLDFFLSCFPEIKARVQHSNLAGALQSSGPFMQQTAGAVSPGMALIGDAAGYADPITGEGIGMGWLHAHLLSQRLADFLPHNVPMPILERYGKDVEVLTRKHMTHARMLLAISQSPLLLKATSQLAAAAPQIVTHIAQRIANGPAPTREMGS
jgi:flavin-dependent dehydrogenase